MKHPLTTTVILVLLFVAAQIVGLSLLSLNIEDVKTEDGRIVVEHGSTALGDRPDTQGLSSLLFIVIGVAVGTVLVLLLIKFRVFGVWKVWFLLAVWFSSTIALGVLIRPTIALIICLGLAVWKVYRPNPIVHNGTEILMYAGIAILLVPLFTLWWAVALLLIISIYDVYAVWHSKHMVVMAQAQTNSKLFAGLLVPRPADDETSAGDTSLEEPVPPSRTTKKQTTTKVSARSVVARVHHAPTSPETTARPAGGSAILGGGDIAFPLIFSGVVMDWLISSGVARTTALAASLTVTLTAAVSLALLFAYAKKDRFYPAMPFLSAGCFAGLGIIALATLLF